MIGQGYDGAVTSVGKISGVLKRTDFLSSCNLHPLFLSQVTAHFDSGCCISEEDKDVFWNHDQRLEVVLLFPPKSRGIEGHPGCSWFPKLKIVKPRDTRWLMHEHCVKAICKDLPPLLQTLSQLYESSGDAGAYGVYSLLASVMVYQAVISSQKFTASLLS